MAQRVGVGHADEGAPRVERRCLETNLVVARADGSGRRVERNLQIVGARGVDLEAEIDAVRAVHRVARLTRDESRDGFSGRVAPLHVHLEPQDLAPVRGTRERRCHHPEGLVDDCVDFALLPAAGGGGFHVQRAAERVVGKLFLQCGVALEQRAGVLRLRGSADQGKAQP
jgi:hypothetical protein